MPSLLIGCGNSRQKKIYRTESLEWTGELVTLDMNPHCGADIVLDLDAQRLDQYHYVLPFEDESFDELAAYDVLEHIGRQGDWRGWFSEMAEYHRILKPQGEFGIIVPIRDDALADPGHTRFFHDNHFRFLTQSFYEEALNAGLPITDYRWFIKNWWEIVHMERQGGHHLGVLLKKV